MSKTGRNLKQIRLDFGYTQEYVAQQLGLGGSASGLRKIENGQTMYVKKCVLEKAAKLFNMTEQEIENYASNDMRQPIADKEKDMLLSAVETYKEMIQEINEERKRDKALIQDLVEQLVSYRK
jgi:transcriptional regulator with XRE-family HTH domain